MRRNNGSPDHTRTIGPDAETIVRGFGGEWRGSFGLIAGPGHSDSDRSLSITDSTRQSGAIVFTSFAGDDAGDCIAHIRSRFPNVVFVGEGRGREEKRPSIASPSVLTGEGQGIASIIELPHRTAHGAELFIPDSRWKGPLSSAVRIVRTHVYQNGAGERILSISKLENGKFSIWYRVRCHRTGVTGWQRKQPKGFHRPLLDFPTLVSEGQGLPIILAEGESDAVALRKAGFRATCAPFGAQSAPSPLYLKPLTSCRWIVAGDFDANGAGEKGAIKRATGLVEAGCRDVWTFALPSYVAWQQSGFDMRDALHLYGADGLRDLMKAEAVRFDHGEVMAV